ncbi:MAG: D-alanine--D-alanine ligase [Peptostreptococcaceae bacterium]|nr:D-alanine--D-alanine ligase [Peptostreptococcaceae bacterium]
MKKMNLAVVFGGMSEEHEVSLMTATSVLGAADKDKYELYPIGITKNGRWMYFDGDFEAIENGTWEETAKSMEINMRDKNLLSMKMPGKINGAEMDMVFPVIHGPMGEDGTIQGLLELSGVPYVGCGVFASAACMDKVFAKQLFEFNGLPIVPYVVLYRDELSGEKECIDKIEAASLGYPLFVKPANLGSSVGITKVHNRSELIKGLVEAAKYDRKILVEKGIDAREIECAVLGNYNPDPSVLGEIIPSHEFYDYKAKYSEEAKSGLVIPANLPMEESDKIRKMAVDAFKALGCTGLARVDFLYDKSTGQAYLNEINTMPGFTKYSMYPMLWQKTDLPYKNLIDRLVSLALELSPKKD